MKLQDFRLKLENFENKIKQNYEVEDSAFKSFGFYLKVGLTYGILFFIFSFLFVYLPLVLGVLGVYDFIAKWLGFLVVFIGSVIAIISLSIITIGAFAISQSEIKKNRNIIYRVVVNVLNIAWFCLAFFLTLVISFHNLAGQLLTPISYNSVGASSSFYYDLLLGEYGDFNFTDPIAYLIILGPALGLFIFSFTVIPVLTFPKYNLFGNFIRILPFVYLLYLALKSYF